MKRLCEEIQGCVFGYTQSDEITLVLTDYATIQTDAWFGYNIQKMASVAASMATMAFNSAFASTVEHEICTRIHMPVDETWEYLTKLRYEKYWKAMFDARVFSIPKEEVCNCLIWRQQDATPGQRGWIWYHDPNDAIIPFHRLNTSVVESVKNIGKDIVVTTMNTIYRFTPCNESVAV